MLCSCLLVQSHSNPFPNLPSDLGNEKLKVSSQNQQREAKRLDLLEIPDEFKTHNTVLLRVRNLEATNSSISSANGLNLPTLKVAFKSVVPEVFKTIDIVLEKVENIVLYVGTASRGDKEVPNA